MCNNLKVNNMNISNTAVLTTFHSARSKVDHYLFNFDSTFDLTIKGITYHCITESTYLFYGTGKPVQMDYDYVGDRRRGFISLLMGIEGVSTDYLESEVLTELKTRYKVEFSIAEVLEINLYLRRLIAEMHGNTAPDISENGEALMLTYLRHPIRVTEASVLFLFDLLARSLTLLKYILYLCLILLIGQYIFSYLADVLSTLF